MLLSVGLSTRSRRRREFAYASASTTARQQTRESTSRCPARAATGRFRGDIPGPDPGVPRAQRRPQQPARVPTNPQPPSGLGREKDVAPKSPLPRAPTEAPTQATKQPICRHFSEWRDPDSNRGHHDFQAARWVCAHVEKPLQISQLTRRAVPASSPRILGVPRGLWTWRGGDVLLSGHEPLRPGARVGILWSWRVRRPAHTVQADRLEHVEEWWAGLGDDIGIQDLDGVSSPNDRECHRHRAGTRPGPTVTRSRVVITPRQSGARASRHAPCSPSRRRSSRARRRSDRSLGRELCI
jgi:hypothetical protein